MKIIKTSHIINYNYNLLNLIISTKFPDIIFKITQHNYKI